LLLLLLRRREFDHVIDAENGDGGLGGEAKRLDLGDGRLHDPRHHVVTDGAADEVETLELKLALGGIGLRLVVFRSELGDELG